MSKDIVKGKITDNRDFDIGDDVLIFIGNGDKISARWKEGFYIKEKMNDSSYTVTNGIQSYRLNKSFIKNNYIRILQKGNVVIA